MKKKFTVVVSFLFVYSIVSYADTLKKNLTNFMNTKEVPSVVNLGNINLNAKPKPKKPIFKHHSLKAVIATINGHKLIKKDADNYLTKRTHGKIKDSDKLPLKQRRRLISEMFIPIIVLDAARKDLSAEEIQRVYARIWMKKEAQKIVVKDEDVRNVYDKIKNDASTQDKIKTIPPFKDIKNRLQAQIIEKQIIGKLMKDVQIEVSE